MQSWIEILKLASIQLISITACMKTIYQYFFLREIATNNEIACSLFIQTQKTGKC
jgi:hypothetical protein